MKKIIALTMTAIIAMGTVTGCATKVKKDAPSAGSSNTQGQTKELKGNITFLANSGLTVGDNGGVKEAVDGFMKEHPGVTVTLEPVVSADLMSKFTTAALAGSGPDVVTLDSAGWAIDAAAMGVLEPLTNRLDGMQDKFLKGPLDSGKYQGDYYSVPWYYNNTGLYYNKEILNKVGIKNPPTNWQELEEDIDKVTKAGYKGIMAKLDGYALFNFFLQAGNSVIDTSSKKPVVTVNNESGKEAFKFFTDLHTKYHAFPESTKEALSWDKTYPPFAQGEVAFLISGDWAYANIKKINPNLDFGIAPMPKGKQAASVLGGYSLSINANSKNKDLAWEFVKYLTDAKQDKMLLALGGRIPARKDADVSSVITKTPAFKAFIDQADSTVTRPQVINSKQVDNLMADAFKSVLLDKNTPDQALKELETALNKLINDNYK